MCCLCVVYVLFMCYLCVVYVFSMCCLTLTLTLTPPCKEADLYREDTNHCPETQSTNQPCATPAPPHRARVQRQSAESWTTTLHRLFNGLYPRIQCQSTSRRIQIFCCLSFIIRASNIILLQLPPSYIFTVRPIWLWNVYFVYLIYFLHIVRIVTYLIYL